jgi:agmatine deiminase
MTENNRRFQLNGKKQQGILLCFPHNGKDWPGEVMGICRIYKKK